MFCNNNPKYCSPTTILSSSTMFVRASRPIAVARGIILRISERARFEASRASFVCSLISSRERHCSFRASAMSFRSFVFSSIDLQRDSSMEFFLVTSVVFFFKGGSIGCNRSAQIRELFLAVNEEGFFFLFGFVEFLDLCAKVGITISLISKLLSASLLGVQSLHLFACFISLVNSVCQGFSCTVTFWPNILFELLCHLRNLHIQLFNFSLVRFDNIFSRFNTLLQFFAFQFNFGAVRHCLSLITFHLLKVHTIPS
mmetsp:Transcript_34099/g.51426  ORF Transcript_34099/g.51426 Transcript_34099/m.51426 type:complete len:256 (-) Transcript_34099:929-1696(-)